MPVAQLRGVHFRRLPDGSLEPDEAASEVLHDVMGEVSNWLGYEHTIKYLSDLPRLKRRIFDDVLGREKI